MRKAISSIVALAILVAIVLDSSQRASARDRRNPDRREQSSKVDPREILSLFKKRQDKRRRDVIAAPNGNTGINGSGLPKPTKKGKNKRGRIIAAPNGNTGINGSGLPR